jgi:hypothetical protein
MSASQALRRLTELQTGIIVKWAILAAFFFIFMGWFLGGYLHAKSRMKKGKPLLGYHRVRFRLGLVLLRY